MEIPLESIDVEFLRQHLKRAFWRLQYKARKKNNTEIYNEVNNNISSESFDTKVTTKLYLENIIKTIPSEKSRYIIVKTVLQGVPEKVVANELKISQQAVNKCKKKILKELAMKIKTSA